MWCLCWIVKVLIVWWRHNSTPLHPANHWWSIIMIIKIIFQVFNLLLLRCKVSRSAALITDQSNMVRKINKWTQAEMSALWLWRQKGAPEKEGNLWRNQETGFQPRFPTQENKPHKRGYGDVQTFLSWYLFFAKISLKSKIWNEALLLSNRFIVDVSTHWCPCLDQ